MNCTQRDIKLLRGVGGPLFVTRRYTKSTSSPSMAPSQATRHMSHVARHKSLHMTLHLRNFLRTGASPPPPCASITGWCGNYTCNNIHTYVSVYIYVQISSYCVHIARTNHVSLLMRWGNLYLNGGVVTTADLICCQWVAFQFSPGKHNLRMVPSHVNVRRAPEPQY
jgi:hypothetical protein